MASLRLGNRLGRRVFRAEPRVWVSRRSVSGGTRVWIILMEPVSLEAEWLDEEGEDGM